MRHPSPLLLLVFAAALAGALIGVFASAAAAQPPAEIHWKLVKAEIHVRAAEGGRYVVEAFLDLAPPRQAHADFDPGGLDFWFYGDPERQRLEVFTGTVNGREVERIVHIHPDRHASRVLLRIEPAARTAPLSAHLVVTLSPHRGRVALPVSTPHDGAEVVIHRPDGGIDRPEKLPLSLVVNAKEAAGPGLPIFQLAIVACFVGTIIFVIAILRRRAPGGSAHRDSAHHEGDRR